MTMFGSPWFGSAGESFDVSYVSSMTKTNNNTDPTTFASMSFGDASDSRVIIACLMEANSSFQNQSASTMTIAGVSATNRVSATNSANGANMCRGWIFTAAVPTGTSGDVVVDWGTAPPSDSTHICMLYRMVAGTALPSDTAEESGGLSYTPTIDCVAGGEIIGVAVTAMGEQTGLGYHNALSIGSKLFTSTQTGLTVGGSWNTTSGDFTHTALDEDNEASTATGLSGQTRGAYVAAAFDPA